MHFDWDVLWGLIWYSLVVFAFIAYLFILIYIVIDLFWRDHTTSGWAKAGWVLFLFLFPLLTALVYLVARGDGMAQRARESAATAKKEADTYIRQAAGRSPAQEIADAKQLLDAGSISQSEFDTLKAKALS